MVRACLAETKTQTRRAVKGMALEWLQPDQFTPEFVADPANHLCPYGYPGDRLWVRETWAYHLHAQSAARDEDGPFVYAADGPSALQVRLATKWTPGIHMFRWASRITLEITEVRVERLQDISEADAKAEGCERLSDDEPGYVERYEFDRNLCPQCGGTRLYTAFNQASGGALPDTDCTRCDTYVNRYRHLWNSISLDPSPLQERIDGKLVTTAYVSYPWSLEDFEQRYGPEVIETRTYRGKPLSITPNPFVWAVSFKNAALAAIPPTPVRDKD